MGRSLQGGGKLQISSSKLQGNCKHQKVRGKEKLQIPSFRETVNTRSEVRGQRERKGSNLKLQAPSKRGQRSEVRGGKKGPNPKLQGSSKLQASRNRGQKSEVTKQKTEIRLSLHKGGVVGYSATVIGA